MIKKSNIKFIDLDLPSGTLWGTKNLNLESESSILNIFFDPFTRLYKNYKEIPVEGDIVSKCFNNENIRIPERKIINELIKNTYTKWSNNPEGRWFFSRKDRNKKIFLPASDSSYYTSRTIGDESYKLSRKLFWIYDINPSGYLPGFLLCDYDEVLIRPVKYKI